MTSEIRGSVQALVMYDVSEEISLDHLRRIVGARTVGPSFKHPAPEYVRFQRPPLVEPLGSLVLAGGEQVEAQVKYYDYGVISVMFEVPFAGDWDSLVRTADQWISGVEVERQAMAIARQKVERAGASLIKPYAEWLNEDYYVFHVREIAGTPAASDLLAECGHRIAQIVRGETVLLSEDEQREVLQASISYYPSDLAVVGWNAAFVYDTSAGAETTVQILEYANSQLLEFRHYDELLTRELAGVYRSLDRGTGIIRRWRLARSATKLQTTALEVTELVERVDNAIKFLSDMFAARLYRLAAAKVGVHDYKDLVNQKLHTANDLYRFMVEQFNQGRAFVLELMVVIILVVELLYLFHGKA
jgi:hypothetical protein